MRTSAAVASVLLFASVAPCARAEDAVAVVQGVEGDRVVERAVGPADLLAKDRAGELTLGALQAGGALPERLAVLRLLLLARGEEVSEWTEATTRERLVEWERAGALMAAAEALGEPPDALEAHRKTLATARACAEPTRAFLEWLGPRPFYAWTRIAVGTHLGAGDVVRVPPGSAAMVSFPASGAALRLEDGAVLAVDAPPPGPDPEVRPLPRLLSGHVMAHAGNGEAAPGAGHFGIQTPLVVVRLGGKSRALVKVHAEGDSWVVVDAGSARILDAATGGTRTLVVGETRTFDARGSRPGILPEVPAGWDRRAVHGMSVLVPRDHTESDRWWHADRAWEATDEGTRERSVIRLFREDVEGLLEGTGQVRREPTTVEGEPATLVSGSADLDGRKVPFRLIHLEPDADGFAVAAMVMATPARWDENRSTFDRVLASFARQDRRGGPEWYCAMHPRFVRVAPGTCPICGMPLLKRRGEWIVGRVGVVTMEIPLDWREAPAGPADGGAGWVYPMRRDEVGPEVRVFRDTPEALKARVGTIAGPTSKPTTLGGLPATVHVGAMGSRLVALIATNAPLGDGLHVAVSLSAPAPGWTWAQPLLSRILATVRIEQ